MDLLREAGVEEIALIAEQQDGGLAWALDTATRPTCSSRPPASRRRRGRRGQEAPPLDRPLPRGHPAQAHRQHVRHQHHAPHRRDAGAADHLHGGDAAGPEGPGHRAAPGHAQPARSSPSRSDSNQVVLGLDDDGPMTVNKSPVGDHGGAGPRACATSSRPAPTRRSSCARRARSSTARWSRPWTSPRAPAWSASGSSPRR